MVVEIKQGVWSEVSLERVVAIVLGHMVVQELEEKNQSSFSRRGFSYLFDQVNLQPLRGISIKLNLLMVLLKDNIS